MAVGQAPTRDIGTPDLYYPNVYGVPLGGDWLETSPDLVFPQNVATYSRMRHDPQLRAVLQAYCLPLLRANWVLDPAGCRDEVVKRCADDLGIGILGLDETPGPARRRGVIWNRHLTQALHNLVYGFMPFELRYRIEGRETRLDHLGQRMPWTVAEIKLNGDATVQSLIQYTQRTPIPANRLVWYVTGQEGANWTGISMLRPAYGAWLIKHEVWRVHATSIRRFGMGVPYVEAPAGATAAQVAEARNLASAMRAGDQAGVGLPQGFRAQLMGLTGSVPDALAFIHYLDQAMAKMVLAGLIELGQTEHGSRALGETFLDLFLLSLQAVADEIATAATSGQEGMPGIVTDLVDQNWGEDEAAPRIVATDVGEGYQVTAQALSMLVSAHALTPDKSLEEWIRKSWRLPQPEEPLPQPPAVPPASGGRGQPVAPGESPPVPGTAPAALPSPPAASSGVSAAAGGLRRALTDREVQAGFDPARLQALWLSALEGLLAAYRPVARAVRAGLVDKVIAAIEAGRLDRLASLEPAPAGGAALIESWMAQAARDAEQQALEEAGGQGVHIAGERVRVDEARLSRLAAVWDTQAGRRLAGEAAQKAAASAAGAGPGAAVAAGDEVATHLDALSDAPLRLQLGAALSAAQNAGRVAVLEAAPESAGTAEYVASEVLDHNTCGPCLANDGAVYPTLGDAVAAYPTGGYLRCEGGMRCRGTVIAVWEPKAVAA